jgi:antirestriction protein
MADIRYKVKGNNFSAQIENGQKFKSLISKVYENQKGEDIFPLNFINEIAHTSKVVKHEGSYYLKDYTYNGTITKFDFLDDNNFLEALNLLDRPAIKKFEEGGEADTEREDEEDIDRSEKLEELMDEYDLPREVIEEYASNMGIEIEDITDLPFSGRYDSEEDFAEDLVEQGAVSNVSYYLDMTTTDMRLLAQEEADFRVDDMRDKEILDAMDMKDEADEYEDLKNEIDDLESEVDDLKSELEDYMDEEDEDMTEGDIESREEKSKELKQEIDDKENELEELQNKLAALDTYDEVVDKAREELRDVYYDDIYDELEKDAVGYFVNNLGYAEEDLVKNTSFSVDYEKLARDLSDSYTYIEHNGDVYVFMTYMNGGMMAKGGGMEEGVDLFEDYENIPPNVQKILDKHQESFEDGDYRGLEMAYNELNKIGYTFEYYLDGQAYDLRKIGQKGKSEEMEDDDYADGGIMAKGGNVPTIEKRVAEVNALIERANELNLTVVDTSGTWQTPMKYKPFKYSNGTLYEEYQELDLYKYNKGRGEEWETKKGKVLKSNMEFDSPLNDIARMYRKALKHFDKYGYADGGTLGAGSFADGGDTGGMTAGRYYTDKNGTEFRFLGRKDSGTNKGKLLFNDGTSNVYKTLDDFGSVPKQKKLFGIFKNGGTTKQSLSAAKKIAIAMKKKS